MARLRKLGCLAILFMIFGCSVTHSLPPALEDFPSCRPASVATKMQRLRSESTFNMVSVRALDGDTYTLLFENSPELRRAVKHIVSGSKAEGNEFTAAEVEALSSELVMSKARFSFPASGAHAHCLGAMTVPAGDWSTASYFETLRSTALQLFPRGKIFTKLQGSFKDGYHATCDDIAALLRCDLLVTRDDYSGRFVITIN